MTAIVEGWQRHDRFGCKRNKMNHKKRKSGWDRLLVVPSDGISGIPSGVRGWGTGPSEPLALYLFCFRKSEQNLSVRLQLGRQLASVHPAGTPPRTSEIDRCVCRLQPPKGKKCLHLFTLVLVEGRSRKVLRKRGKLHLFRPENKVMLGAPTLLEGLDAPRASLLIQVKRGEKKKLRRNFITVHQ